jgi:serine/threonine protein kinase
VVALKVLQNPVHRDDESRALLRGEIRATARLSHPNIVSVLDVGTVAESIEVSGRSIRKGQDFLVVELVEGGSLDSLERLAWADVKQILIHVLAGLGHAHACGVIHCDVKPANILLDRLESGELLPKVADFGLAHMDPEETLRGNRSSAGTPAYMAPEQITGHLRDHGPWTDLYAVGCMAYELVSGEPPFVAPHYLDVLRKHTEEEMPPLPANAVAPEGFESWLARLLAKRPRRRFLHAADAAQGLLNLGDPEMPDVPTSSTTPTAGWGVESTVVMSTVPIYRGETLPVRGPSPAAENSEEVEESRPHLRRLPVRPPPMPSTWRVDEDRQTLRRTGVALFGVRPTPLLERAREKRELWDRLAEVRRAGAPRCVVLEGDHGSGKTKLGEWFMVHAGELGAATVIRTAHAPLPTQFHGVSGMFRRYFRLGGMEEAEARDRVRSWLQELGAGDAADETEKLVRWVSRQGRQDSRQPLDYGLLDVGHRLLELATRNRPVILFVDDAQWGRNTMTFVLQLLQRGDLPVLAVCAVGPPGEADDAYLASGLIETLTGREETTVLPLEPLSHEAQRDLLVDHYGLQFEAAVHVLDRSAGNPVFTENLLRDAIERGALVQTRAGWELDPSSDVTLPSDVSSLMLERARRFAAGFGDPESALHALEAGAVLGGRFDETEWRRVCTHAGILRPLALLERAAEAGLLIRTESDWEFADERFREAVLQHANGHGRLVDLHRACALALEPLIGTNELVLLPRYARHLAQANRGELALRPLLDAARVLLAIGDARASFQLLDLFRDTASAVELGVDDPVVVEALCLYGRIALLRLDLRTGLKPMLEAGLASARRVGDSRSIAESLGALTFWELCQGTMARAVSLARETMRALEGTDEPLFEFLVLVFVSVTLSCVGEAELADQMLEDVFSRMDPADRPTRTSVATNAVEITMYGGLEDALERWIARAEELTDPTLSPSKGMLSLLHAYLADVRDDHETLLQCATAAEEEAMFSQRHRRFVARWMSALSRVRHEPSTVTQEELSSLVQILSPQLYEHARVRIGQCVLSLHRGEPERADEYLEMARPGLETGKVIFVVARDSEDGARTARELGFEDSAIRLAEIAAAQWRGLGRTKRALAVEREFGIARRETVPD